MSWSQQIRSVSYIGHKRFKRSINLSIWTEVMRVLLLTAECTYETLPRMRQWDRLWGETSLAGGWPELGKWWPDVKAQKASMLMIHEQAWSPRQRNPNNGKRDLCNYWAHMWNWKEFATKPAEEAVSLNKNSKVASVVWHRVWGIDERVQLVTLWESSDNCERTLVGNCRTAAHFQFNK